jgi:O-antigen/teichoic acid export membrane protein
MSNSGRIAKNTFFLYFRSFFVLIISLYTSRVILRVLGVVDYGIFNVVGGVISMVGFLKGSMQATFQRYYNVEMGKGNNERVKELFRSSLSTQFILAILIVILAETLGLWFVKHKLVIPEERVVAALWIYQVAIVSFVISVFCAPFDALITAYERMGVFAVISIVDAVLKLLIVFLLEFIPYDNLIVYAVLLLMIGILNISFYAIYCKRKIPTTDIRFNWDKHNLKSMFSFSGWSLMDTLSHTLKSQGINIVLNMFFGPVVNAARGIAYQVLNAVNHFIQSFQTSFRPQLTKSYASGDYDYMTKLYYSATKISYYLIFTISLPIILETPLILHFWLGDNVPEYAVVFTRLVLVTAFVSAYANPTSCIAYATGNIKWFSIIVSGLNLMILPVAYLFLKLGYGPVSALVVSLVMTILVQLTRIIVTSKITVLDLPHYFKHVVLPTGIYSVLCPCIPYIVHRMMHPGFIRLMIICIISVLVSLAGAWFIGMNKYEKNLVLSKLKGVKGKRKSH